MAVFVILYIVTTLQNEVKTISLVVIEKDEELNVLRSRHEDLVYSMQEELLQTRTDNDDLIGNISIYIVYHPYVVIDVNRCFIINI